MKNYLLSFCCILVVSVNAQNWHWARKADATASAEAVSFLRTDGNGNVYLFGDNNGGTKYGSTILQSGYFIVKLDSMGTVIWAKNINFSYTGGYAQMNDFNVDNSGNVYMTGRLFGNLQILNFNFVSNGQEDIYIIKLDPSGNSLWGRSFGGTGADIVGQIAFDDSQNIYMTGEFMQSITFGNYSLSAPGKQFYLTKLDPSGQALWSTKGDACFGHGNSLRLDKKANVYVVAVNQCWYLQTSFAKFDSSGTLISYTTPWGAYDYVSSFNISDNGNIYLLHNGGGHYGYVPILVKYDSLMNEQWNRCTGTYYGCYGIGVGLHLDRNENIFLAGSVGSEYCNSDSVYFQNQLVYVGNKSAPSITKFDANGNFVWIKKALAAGFDGISHLCQDKSGNLLTAGGFNYNGGGQDTLVFDSNVLTSDGNWQQIFIAKLNPEMLTNVAVQSQIQRSVTLFPNPSSGIFTLNLNSVPANVCVFDVLGNCVLSKNCRGEQNPTIDLSYHSKGVYIVQIVTEGRKMINKIVVD